MCIQAKYSKSIYKKNEVSLSFQEKQAEVFTPDDRQYWSFPVQITVLESLSSSLWTWQLPIIWWLWDGLMRLVFVLKMVLFSYCVIRYVSIWKIWVNVIQWQRQQVETNSSSRIQKYTFVITLLEMGGMKIKSSRPISTTHRVQTQAGLHETVV